MSARTPSIGGIDTTTAGARRVLAGTYGLRLLALTLVGVTAGTTFHGHGTPATVWAVLVVYVVAWPHVARLVLMRSRDPSVAHWRCFLVDAAMIGVFIALTEFSLLPAVLLATMTAMTLITVEGVRRLATGMAVQAAACALAWAANGFAFAPQTTTFEMVASLPLLVVFPMTLGFATHELARRVRQQNQQLLRLGSIDSVSGLLNRGHWEDAARNALAEDECGTDTLLLIDIDWFKQVNDRHGHTTGDEVIRHVGAAIRHSIRGGDLAGRYGGDEFAVILRGSGMHAAESVAERIRAGVAEPVAGCSRGLRCTLSIGVALNAATSGLPGWLAAADGALYRAKLAGRNRTAAAA